MSRHTLKVNYNEYNLFFLQNNILGASNTERTMWIFRCEFFYVKLPLRANLAIFHLIFTVLYFSTQETLISQNLYCFVFAIALQYVLQSFDEDFIIREFTKIFQQLTESVKLNKKTKRIAFTLHCRRTYSASLASNPIVAHCSFSQMKRCIRAAGRKGYFAIFCTFTSPTVTILSNFYNYFTL